ncbi:MAG: pitrilysin family protein [Alistipes sp.]
MITYKKQILANGLTVIVNRDHVSKLAAVNILYKVGARNEDPLRTGFAHLFEHLMFRGTKQVPNFDLPVQMACGENNAFTNNDYTDFYITLPVDNIETALWLESDRMTGLSITRRTLSLEKRVVIEEFKQRYLNQPYGDRMMLLRAMAYKTHPYRWATIGLAPEHIECATLQEVKEFYGQHYHPAHAILSISADLEEDRMLALAEKWFASIAISAPESAPIPQELPQVEARREVVEREVPATSLTLAYHIGGRLSDDFFRGDLISDLLAGGESARLPRHLIREQKLFASVNAYISGDVDPGLFVFTGELLPGTSEEQAEQAFMQEIATLQSESVEAYELEKVQNKFEANTLFGEINVMNKAMNLGFYEMLGDLPLINREIEIYRAITPAQIIDFSRRIFRPENSSTLIYRAKR